MSRLRRLTAIWPRYVGLRVFWHAIPLRARLLLLGAVFSSFATIGFVTDILALGQVPLWRLWFNVVFAGAMAVGYLLVSVTAGPVWLVPLFVVHFSIPAVLARLFPAAGPTAAPTAAALAQLDARFGLDGAGILACAVLGYTGFVAFIAREGGRALKAHTEMALAAKIHASLVPALAGRHRDFGHFGRSAPSGDVGGDLVDVVAHEGGWVGYVADVSGHGVSSGVLMAMVKSAVRTRLRRAADAGGLLHELNDVLCPMIEPHMFVTAAVIRDPGDGRLEVAGAGHVPLLWYRAASGDVAEVPSGDIAIGIMPGRPYDSGVVIVPGPGDLIALVTDGLTEVFDAGDHEFGMDRVKALLAAQAGRPLREMADALLAAARRHGAQMDDQTLLLVRRVEGARG